MISGTLQNVSTLLITVGLPNKPWVVGKRRFDAREAALAFDGFQQRGFLAANIGARAQPHFDIEVQSGAENISADDAGLARLGHRFAHDFEGVTDTLRARKCNPGSRPRHRPR